MAEHPNVEVVRRIYEAAAKRDADTIFELYDPEVELDNTRVQVTTGGVYRGHDGLRQMFREWHEAWGDITYDYEELIDAGGEDVVAVVTRHARGRASGVDVERPVALLWTIRNGRAVRVVWFDSRDEALAAAGA